MNKKVGIVLVGIFGIMATTMGVFANEPVTSKLGFTAVAAPNGEEGGADTRITKDGKPLAIVSGAKPVSFSPDGRILLLREAGADDDLKHFFLNLAAGEHEKTAEQLKNGQHRVGGRAVVKSEWSPDGKFVTFYSFYESEPPVKVKVSDHCAEE